MIGVTIKYQEDTIMVNYKEILRLSAEGNSQRQIAAGSGNSRNTVIEVLESAKSHNITWPLDGSVTNEQLEAILFPNRYASDNAYLAPDFAYIHKELAKPSFADWLNNQIIRDQLKFDIKVCLIKNGYPPQYSPEVFRKVMEQIENFEENN